MPPGVLVKGSWPARTVFGAGFLLASMVDAHAFCARRRRMTPVQHGQHAADHVRLDGATYLLPGLHTAPARPRIVASEVLLLAVHACRRHVSFGLPRCSRRNIS